VPVQQEQGFQQRQPGRKARFAAEALPPLLLLVPLRLVRCCL
jgi:hypothetical protein